MRVNHVSEGFENLLTSAHIWQDTRGPRQLPSQTDALARSDWLLLRARILSQYITEQRALLDRVV
jgi:hypothetical protein